MSRSQAQEGSSDATGVCHSCGLQGTPQPKAASAGDTRVLAFCFFSMLAREPLSLRAGAGVTGGPPRLPGHPRCSCGGFGVAAAAELSARKLSASSRRLCSEQAKP